MASPTLSRRTRSLTRVSPSPAPTAVRAPTAHNLPSLEGGIVGLPTSGPAVTSLNAQSVANFSQFGSLTSNPQFQDPYTYNPKINYTWIKGRSTYKAGYEYVSRLHHGLRLQPGLRRRHLQRVLQRQRVLSSLAFSPEQPPRQAASTPGSKEGVALSDFLFGARDTYQLDNNTLAHLNQRFHFFYFPGRHPSQLEADHQRRSALRARHPAVGVRQPPLQLQPQHRLDGQCQQRFHLQPRSHVQHAQARLRSAYWTCVPDRS